MSEDRLNRIEGKLDDLQKAIISLARVEERLVTVFNRQTNIESKVNSMNNDLQTLTAKIGSMYAERIFWIILAAGIAVIGRYI
jgi:vacuolar-type H+-ATPase subunit E/Vma4